MRFQKHSSDEMVELFRLRPFQGQDPEKASIIFLSSDANYAPEISKPPFFGYILEYQRDGIAFWRRYDCHHPFMLPEYPKELNKNKHGVPFHRNFSKLGLGSEYAGHISFLELLDVPTIGNKSEDKQAFFNLLSMNHLRYIENLIIGGGHKLFFISHGVLNDIDKIRKTYPVFDWLAVASDKSRRYCHSINGNRIKEIYHFSSAQIHGQMREIKTEIDIWLRDCR